MISVQLRNTARLIKESGGTSLSKPLECNPDEEDLGEEESSASPAQESLSSTSPPVPEKAMLKTSREEEEAQLTTHTAILRLLEPKELLRVMYRCARVSGLDVHEGLLLFGRQHFYIIDGYTITNTKEIIDIDSLPEGARGTPVIPLNEQPFETERRPQEKQFFKVAYEKIREVHCRRCLLQQIAVEVFNADGCNVLLAFTKGLQKRVFALFNSLATNLLDDSSVSGSNRTGYFLHQLFFPSETPPLID
ncbi:WD repeat and FYVE domain-containing protein 3 [Cichlidogyrus casuarinus]|uniref:WD repeat and FYVE domain-containing protein 3 n=1 Tax=Cichlidogyrus casuarinus TaxID=1844966 RepID=A0ABD2Q8M5_9PLAT